MYFKMRVIERTTRIYPNTYKGRIEAGEYARKLKVAGALTEIYEDTISLGVKSETYYEVGEDDEDK